ncbi:STAS domain-containing protein [Actinoplanes sp. G11-F43]|uniref:STAS domain-containing protein n=1 Tax=Actinoplanes sp. G11-F43 TaxID=3424130 RepID=UPI003D3449D5
MSLRRFDFTDLPSTRLELTVIGPDAADHLTVILIGELDADEAERLHETLSAALNRHVSTQVHLDATALTFVDSGGIRALLQCRDLTDQAGAQLFLDHVHPNAYQVLEITGLVEILKATRLTTPSATSADPLDTDTDPA